MRTIDADALVAQWEAGIEEVEDVIAKMFIGAAISDVKHAPTIDPEPHWIPCNERMPECEQEVLVCTETKLLGKDAYIDSIITPAIYEDGTMTEVESKWSWYDMDFDEWDDECDCGIVPEGWWENRHFNLDGDYNHVIDRKVVAWMPLPEPWKGADDD